MKTLLKWIFVAMITAGLAACGGGGDEGDDNVDTSTVPLAETPSIVHELTARFNVFRAKGVTCGNKAMPPVKPLTGYRPELRSAIQAHLADMNSNNFFSHTGSNGSTLRERTNKAGYPRNAPTGEILANGVFNMDSLSNGWINSPSHCVQIMDPNYSTMGAAQKGKFYGVVFGN